MGIALQAWIEQNVQEDRHSQYYRISTAPILLFCINGRLKKSVTGDVLSYPLPIAGEFGFNLYSLSENKGSAFRMVFVSLTGTFCPCHDGFS